MIDTIREGTAPSVIRRKGAAGELQVSLAEKIEILTYLAQDSDEITRDLAFATLQSWNPEELQQILSNPATPAAVLDFAATYLAHERKDCGGGFAPKHQLAQDLRNMVKDLMTAFAVESTAAPARETAPESPAAPPNDGTGAHSSAVPAPIPSSASPEHPGGGKTGVKKKTLLEK